MGLLQDSSWSASGASASSADSASSPGPTHSSSVLPGPTQAGRLISSASMVTIELNQSQLAEMAGGSRQSVNQAIGSFASRGWLRTEGRRIVVTDLPALRRRAGMADR